MLFPVYLVLEHQARYVQAKNPDFHVRGTSLK
jgi:hypothetical protein